jgi:hypothetical protein
MVYVKYLSALAKFTISASLAGSPYSRLPSPNLLAPLLSALLSLTLKSKV